MTVKEFFKIIRQSMGGYPEVADPALCLLFKEIIDDAPARIIINRYGDFTDVMKQVEVKIVYPAFLQLILEDFRRIVRFRDLMSRIFIGEVKGFPRVS